MHHIILCISIYVLGIFFVFKSAMNDFSNSPKGRISSWCWLAPHYCGREFPQIPLWYVYDEFVKDINPPCLKQLSRQIIEPKIQNFHTWIPLQFPKKVTQIDKCNASLSLLIDRPFRCSRTHSSQTPRGPPPPSSPGRWSGWQFNRKCVGLSCGLKTAWDSILILWRV